MQYLLTVLRSLLTLTRVELPSLEDVKGSVNVQSTTDISDFCDFFNDLKSDGAIQGGNKCRSNNEQANEGEDGGTSNSSNDDDSAAGSVNINMALLALVGVVGLSQLF